MSEVSSSNSIPSTMAAMTIPAFGLEGMVRAATDLIVENIRVRLKSDETLSQKGLAGACGVSESLVSSWLALRRTIEVKYFDGIAAYLEIPVSHLFLDETDTRSGQLSIDAAIRLVSKSLSAKKQIEVDK